jgi:hypothetical protein
MVGKVVEGKVEGVAVLGAIVVGEKVVGGLVFSVGIEVGNSKLEGLAVGILDFVGLNEGELVIRNVGEEEGLTVLGKEVGLKVGILAAIAGSKVGS